MLAAAFSLYLHMIIPLCVSALTSSPKDSRQTGLGPILVASLKLNHLLVP